jgi:formylglycine-generating enzyme required for sulfatase activity
MAEIPEETVIGEGDAEFTDEGGLVAPAAESLRDGAAPSALDMLPPVGTAASAAPSGLASEAEEPTRETVEVEPDAIAELAWNATSDVETPQFGRYFRDCVECPDMAEIEPGVLTPDVTEDALAAPVMLRKRIAVAAKETTFEEWAACVADGACSPASDSGWGMGKQPVINVSWGDALAFVLWLSEKTGHSYRLPTELEWEFTARGGSPTAFSFGAAAAADKANFDATRPDGGPAGASRGRPLAVASFASNAFGVYDMHGNVAEWTADCWTGDAESILAVSGGDCSARIIKGGAWNDGGSELRASYREGEAEDARRNNLGFRVVRDLP